MSLLIDQKIVITVVMTRINNASSIRMGGGVNG